MNKKDNKGLRIAGFFLILALTGFMGYTAIIGWGPNRIGSAFNVKQGLDLAGGVRLWERKLRHRKISMIPFTS